MPRKKLPKDRIKDYKTTPVELLKDGQQYMVFRSMVECCKYLGMNRSAASNAIRMGYHLKGYEIRVASELALTLWEIKQRDKQPYQFTRP